MKFVYLTLTLFCLNVLLFTVIYNYTFKLDGMKTNWSHSFYASVMMQTATGYDMPMTARHSVAAATVQAILAYTIAIGFIVTFFHSFTSRK